VGQDGVIAAWSSIGHQSSAGCARQAGIGTAIIAYLLESGMLLKYLNELDDAVREVDRNPCPATLNHCAGRLAIVEDYLASQIEPVRRRGREILENLVPPELYASICSPRRSEFPLAL
jgi:hypothetical protein